MSSVIISPDSRTALLDWAQDILGAPEGDHSDGKVRHARRVWQALDRGCEIDLSEDGMSGDVLTAMWSCSLGESRDADAIRVAEEFPQFGVGGWQPNANLESLIAENVARENLEDLAARAAGEYRELVAVVIDAVLTLGPANEPDTVRCWAERRLSDATQMLIEAVAQAGQGGGAA